MPHPKREDAPKTMLPENLSFLAPHAGRTRRAARGRSWVRGIAWRLLRPMVTLMMLSALMPLAIGLAIWVFTPSWLIEGSQWFLGLSGAIGTESFSDWTRDALENLSTFGDRSPSEPSPPVQPVNLPPEPINPDSPTVT